MAMDVIQCKYFPILPARWYCQKCNVSMANECAKEIVPYHPDNKKVCPICLSPLNSIGIANSITPFWYRIPKFFTYPVKRDTLIYIAVLSVCLAVGLSFPIANIVVSIITFFCVLNYACKCLSHSARGNISPPDVFGGTEANYDNISLKQCAILFFIVYVISFAFGINIYLGFCAIFFSLLSIPAITMLLAMSGSFINAVNPIKAIKVMIGMGKSYLILYLFLLLMAGSSELVEFFAVKVINENILLPILFFISSYFTVAMFSMMGYAVYQYHEEFGFDDVEEVNLAENGIDIRDAGISQDSFLNEIHILVSEGMQEEAIKRLKKQIKDTPQNMTYRDKYHNLLKMSNNAKDITTHTEEYIKLLLKETKVHKGKIITIYTDCLKINPDYFYPDANVTVDLAKTAQELFRNNDALSLLNKFAQNYPNSDQIPYAYFTVAQLLVDHKQQEAQAKKILNSILNKYPNHDLTTKITDYMVLIDKLKS